jgi:hypothetical protein
LHGHPFVCLGRQRKDAFFFPADSTSYFFCATSVTALVPLRAGMVQ